MPRLLTFICLATLLVLVVCGSGAHKAQPHNEQLDRLELPPAVAATTVLESTPAPAVAPLLLSVTGGPKAVGAHTVPRESISLLAPLAASSVLRV